jgi:ankyrin repeat protein
MGDIWEAATAGDLGDVEALVGEDPGLVDAKGFGGLTPLILAASGGHEGVVRYLLDNGAGINECTEGSVTALYSASMDGFTPVVRLLLQRGADQTIAQKGGWTPLMEASNFGHLEIVRLLVDAPGVKTIIDSVENMEVGGTALYRACEWGHAEIARALLACGADPTIADRDGKTPMTIAKEVPQQDDDVPEHEKISAEGRLECVALLQVSRSLAVSSLQHCLRRRVLTRVWWVGGRRRRGPISCGRPGRWPTSKGTARWRWRGGRTRRRR